MKTQISVQSIEEFLSRKLHAHSQMLDDGFDEDTLWYVGQMLASFVDRRQLFVFRDGHFQIPTLAFLYRDASFAGSHQERCCLLRKLGDTALFVGALYSEHYARRGISQRYLIGMGCGAYAYLAENFDNANHAFAELSERFPSALKLVADVCEKENSVDAQDILQLYTRWVATKDSGLKARLTQAGIATNMGEGLH